MSEVEEHKTDIREVSVQISDIIETIITNLEDEIMQDTKVVEDKNIVEDVLVKSFLQLFESFLTQDVSKLSKINITLTPEIQQYFLLLCKECPDLFGIFEETLKQIILDNKIDTKDIPDILLLVSKVHNIIHNHKDCPAMDYYDVIQSLIHVALVVYLEKINVKNSQLLLDVLKIVKYSIDLIKIKPLKPKKVGCLFGIFNC